MKRQRLIALLLVVLFLTACLGGRSETGLITIELRGVLADLQEVVVASSQRTYLLNLGSQTMSTFSLESGTWWIQGFSRDADGRVVSASEALRVQGGRQMFIALGLISAAAQTTRVRPQNMLRTWPLAGGVELTWEYDPPATGTWEVWRRYGSSVLWQKAKTLSGTERVFVDPDPAAYEYAYALRYVAPKVDGLLPSPLEEGDGVGVGMLDVTWDFQHEFSPVSLRYSAMGFPMEAEEEPAYTDLVVHFRTESLFAKRRELLATLGLRLKGEIPSLLAVLVEPEPQSERSLEDWSTYQDEHLFIEPNWIVTAKASGPQVLESAWYLEYLRIPAAHQETRGDRNVRIAVVDTGLQVSPAALPASVQVIPGYNFVDGHADTSDDHTNSHGTKVAQTISQAIPNVTLQPVKVLGSSGSGGDFQVSEGILFAAGLHDTISNPFPCQIMNLSLGQSSESTLMRKRVELVSGATDTLIIAASGNARRGALPGSVFYPAALPQVLAVGAIEATASEPKRAGYSCYGPEIDLVAPPSFRDGTSFAAALVSGVAGLILSQGWDVLDIPSILAATAIDLGATGWDEEHGHGLVNAEWAVKNIEGFTLKLVTEGQTLIQVDLPLKGASKRFFLPPGEYTVEAWVNLQGGLEPAIGDYASGPTLWTITEHQGRKATLTLREKVN